MHLITMPAWATRVGAEVEGVVFEMGRVAPEVFAALTRDGRAFEGVPFIFTPSIQQPGDIAIFPAPCNGVTIRFWP